MPAYYTYLISSLPMLSFFAKLPFSLEVFFTKCKNLIPEKEFENLCNVCAEEKYSLGIHDVVSLKLWVNFEIALRNELVRFRAVRKKIEPLKFLHFPDSFPISVMLPNDNMLGPSILYHLDFVPIYSSIPT